MLQSFMKKYLILTALLLITFISIGMSHLYLRSKDTFKQISGAPPYGLAESEVPPLDPWQELKQNWKRPNGPPKVGLQVGHLKNEEVPEELKNLLGNTGASSGGYSEVEVNMAIAEKIAEILRTKGIVVDILPTTVPPDYWADAFIAIHADGSLDTNTSGFKIAAPWRDLTGKSSTLVAALEKTYSEATGLAKDSNITRNMRGYYAFSWWKYEHSIHPMTTSVIVETGFLTNKADRALIAGQPSIPAQALANGIMDYLLSENLM